MPVGWGQLAAELAKAGNKILEHQLRPVAEKMKGLRYKNLKRWLKWKEKSDDAQDKRKERARERDEKARKLGL